MDVGHAVKDLTRRFQAAGIETARLDARVLLAHVMEISAERVFGYPETVLTDAQISCLSSLSERRSNREPLARVVGEKEFWSLPFQLSNDTLVPRPETETVVEAVLDQLVNRHAAVRVLDMGTGSGCLLISLLSELSYGVGVGVDISDGALRIAKENASRNGVGERAQFIQNDWCQGLADVVDDNFDIIISNPPYIPFSEIETLEPEVSKHEPRRALDGGEDGLDFYRSLLHDTQNLLGPTGVLALEIGWDQAASVEDLGRREGLRLLDKRRDLAGIARCVVFSN